MARQRIQARRHRGSRPSPAIHGLCRDPALRAPPSSFALAPTSCRPYQWDMSPDPRILDARARHLLRTLIAEHVQEGEPIGSRTLAKRSGLDVSPATIRNILADLEDIGLVAAPHASAGRVPTAQGYRVFVDSLLQL